MTEPKKFRAKIRKEEERLCIEVRYPVSVTSKDVESIRDYEQWRFSQLTGKEVPREEIIVNLKEGQIVTQITSFKVELGKEIYPALKTVHQSINYVLPKLVEELKKYSTKDEKETALINHAIGELEKIINTI